MPGYVSFTIYNRLYCLFVKYWFCLFLQLMFVRCVQQNDQLFRWVLILSTALNLVWRNVLYPVMKNYTTQVLHACQLFSRFINKPEQTAHSLYVDSLCTGRRLSRASVQSHVFHKALKQLRTCTMCGLPYIPAPRVKLMKSLEHFRNAREG